jgi:hypothetical protein
VSAMKSAIRRLIRVQIYKEQLAVCEQVLEALSKELGSASLVEDARVASGHLRDNTLKESNGLRFMIDRLEREAHEEIDRL